MITKLEIEFMEMVEDLKHYPDLPPIPGKAKEYIYTAYIDNGVKVKGRAYVDEEEDLEEVIKEIKKDIKNKFEKFLKRGGAK